MKCFELVPEDKISFTLIQWMFLMRQILLLTVEINFLHALFSFCDISEPGTENTANNREDSPD